jgi:hypothetical protein
VNNSQNFLRKLGVFLIKQAVLLMVSADEVLLDPQLESGNRKHTATLCADG